MLSSDSDFELPLRILESPHQLIKKEIKCEVSVSFQSPQKLEDSKPPASCYTASPSPVPDLKSWLANFYALNITAAFDRTGKNRSRGHGAKFIFFQIFPGIEFKKSTFYNNKKRWKCAPSEERMLAIDAGHTDAGLWSMFTDCMPAKAFGSKARDGLQDAYSGNEEPL